MLIIKQWLKICNMQCMKHLIVGRVGRLGMCSWRNRSIITFDKHTHFRLIYKDYLCVKAHPSKNQKVQEKRAVTVIHMIAWGYSFTNDYMTKVTQDECNEFLLQTRMLHPLTLILQEKRRKEKLILKYFFKLIYTYFLHFF